MHVEFTLTLDWWQYALAVLGAVWAIGAVFFVAKGAGLRFGLIWPLFFLIGGIRVQ